MDNEYWVKLVMDAVDLLGLEQVGGPEGQQYIEVMEMVKKNLNDRIEIVKDGLKCNATGE